VEKLAEWLAGELAPGDAKVKEQAKRAARLCKADLVTQMVYEFPSLQGIMGGYYAKISGEPEAVARAVGEHYLPRSFEDIKSDNTPKTTVGEIVSIGDKIDSIVGCWGVGLAPTGSADPFAIRRQALGIIKIMWDKNYSLSVNDLVARALEQLKGKINVQPSTVAKEVTEFFRDRLRILHIEGGVMPFDLVDSVLSVWDGNIPDASRRIRAMRDWKYNSSNFDPLMVAFKRVVRIIEGEPGKVDQKLFEHETEKALYQTFKEIERKVRPLLAAKEYGQALSEIASLKPAVDKFFDDVMVNVEDKQLRANRHALLAEIRAMFREFADFSKVVTAG
jgi:glycyl-tRNA synthetase beta chain